MPHYRVSRPNAYGPGTPGSTEPSARQGYYTDADDPEDAARMIRARWLRDPMAPEVDQPLDIQLWGEGKSKDVVRIP